MASRSATTSSRWARGRAFGLLSLGLTGALSLAGVAALLLLLAWREWRPAAQGCASREM